ncbi:MAG: hypothetical protein AB1540_06400 [Bdellovibrionota bacterium]
MVRSDKDSAAQVSTDEGEEIDRIMQEIEDLEKRMDPPQETEQTSLDTRAAQETQESAKVVALHAPTAESLAETDAVPAPDEPLVRSAPTGDQGDLSLKIGGCTQVSLEFSSAGMTVTLSYSDDALSITTDQGAEFRIPFKRGA